MTFSSAILNIAKSGLSAQQAVIATTGNNITNVNTEGYTRRRVTLRENTSQQVGLAVGRGVRAEDVERLGDDFLERVLRTAIGEQGFSGVQEELLSRAQGVFDITGEVDTIGTTLEQFFGSLSDLTVSPADQELKANVLHQASALTASIRRTYDALATLQNEADQRLGEELETLNGITSELADLNATIQQIESGGSTAAGERDRRDQLLKELAEIVEVQVVEDNNSQILVYLPSGFSLVAGAEHRELELTKAPSFAPLGAPPGLDGSPLSFIVYDYDRGSGTEHVDFTSMIAQGTGKLGGLLNVRGVHDSTNTSPFQAQGQLVELASRVEALARVLLTEFNQAYLGVSQSNLVSSGGNPLADDETPTTTPTTFSPSSGYYDAITGTSNAASFMGLFDYVGAADSPTGSLSGLPDATDLSDVESTYYSFASRIKVAITDKNQLATGRDLDPAEGALAIFPGDSANIEELVALRTQRFQITVGNYSMNSTLSEGYQGIVNELSNNVITARSNSAVAKSTQLSAQSQRDNTAGVSLDEEFSNLIRFQRAFEASARMIRIADDMLETILGLI